MDTQRRIGIDARFLTHPQPGGFKTYTENLVRALADVDTVNEYVLYVDRPVDAGSQVPGKPNFHVRVVPANVPILGVPWREQVALAKQAKLDRLDLLHCPCLTAPLRTNCPLVVTLHDMIWYEPAKYSQSASLLSKRKLMEWYYRQVPKLSAERALAIITVSEAAKRDIIDLLHIPRERVYVTPEAAGKVYRPIKDEARLARLRDKVGLGSDFVLAIGSADPRKNIGNLLSAFAALPAAVLATYQLAVVWTHPHLSEQHGESARRLGIQDKVRFLRQVGDEDLAVLYNAATLFAFPSRYEGFGLPLLEAMACGTPVVAADNSSIPEIAGDAAVYFDAEDQAAMTSALTKVLMDKDLRRDLVRRGRIRAAGFSWIRCAHATLDAYRGCFQ